MVSAFEHGREQKMITGLIALGALVVIGIPVTISHVKK